MLRCGVTRQIPSFLKWRNGTGNTHENNLNRMDVQKMTEKNVQNSTSGYAGLKGEAWLACTSGSLAAGSRLLPTALDTAHRAWALVSTVRRAGGQGKTRTTRYNIQLPCPLLVPFVQPSKSPLARAAGRNDWLQPSLADEPMIHQHPWMVASQFCGGGG